MESLLRTDPSGPERSLPEATPPAPSLPRQFELPPSPATHILIARVAQHETPNPMIYLYLLMFINTPQEYVVQGKPVTIKWDFVSLTTQTFSSRNGFNKDIVKEHTKMVISRFTMMYGCQIDYLILRPLNAAADLSIMHR